jgi:hypothetical protein
MRHFSSLGKEQRKPAIELRPKAPGVFGDMNLDRVNHIGDVRFEDFKRAKEAPKPFFFDFRG